MVSFVLISWENDYIVEIAIFISNLLNRVGDHNIDVEETEEQEFSISSIEIHRDFNVGPFLNNDIAVATLGHLNSQNQNGNADFISSGGIAFGQYVGPACLPSEQYR